MATLEGLNNWANTDSDPAKEQQKQDLKQSMFVGVQSDPDQQAKVINLSSKTGLSPNIVSPDFKSISQDVKIKQTDYKNIVDNYPGLTKWFSNPTNASISHDDLDNLKPIDKGVSQYNQDVGSFFDAPLLSWYGSKKHVWQAAAAMGLVSNKSAIDGITYNQMMLDSIREIQPEYVKKKQEIIENMKPGFELAQSTTMRGLNELYDGQIKNGLSDFVNGNIGELGGLMDRIAQEGINYKATAYEMFNPVDLILLFGTGGLGEAGAKAVLGPLAGPLVKKSAFAIGSMLGNALPSFGSAVEESLQDRGIDQNDPIALDRAFSDSNFMSLIRNEATKTGLVKEAVIGSLPFITGGKSFAGNVVKLAAPMTAGTAADQAIKEKPFNMPEIINSLASNLSQGVVFEAGFSAQRKLFSPDPVTAAKQIVEKTNSAIANVRNAQLVSDIRSAMESSKTYQRSPEATESLIEASNPNAKRSVNVADWDRVLTEKGIPPAVAVEEIMNDGGKAYQEAKNRGGDITFPLSRYMKEVSNPEIFQALQPFLKSEANGETVKQSAEFLGELRETMSQIAKEASQQAPAGEVKGEPLPEALLIARGEIEKAIESQGFYSAADNPETLGMTGDKAARLTRAKEDWISAARDQLTKKVIEQKEHEKNILASKERIELRQKVEEQINKRPEFVAASVLKEGKMPDGSELPEGSIPIKLNREELVEQYGKDVIDELPKGITSKDGVLLEDAANYFGYGTGQQLLDGLKVARDKNSVVDRITDSNMRYLHPDLMNPIDLSEEAMKAIHNDKRNELTKLAMEHLVSEDLPVLKDMIRSVVKKLPPNFEVKMQAKRQIESTPIGELNPNEYLRTEAMKTREAADSLAKLDIASTVEAKKQERLNGELYRYAIEQKDLIDENLKYVNRFSKESTRQRIGKFGKGYLEQIDGLLNRFGLGENVPEEKENINDWITGEREKGYDPAISDLAKDENKTDNYKNLTSKQFNDLIDSVRSIENIGKQYGEMLANQKYQSFNDLKDSLLKTAGENFDLTIPPRENHPGLTDRLKSNGKGFLAYHTKMEFLFRWLDKHEALGDFHQAFFQPTVESEKVENNFKRDIVKNLFSIFDKYYSENERAQWASKRTYIKALEDTQLEPNLSKQELLSIGLNLRNEYNRSTLKNWGFSERHIQEIAKHFEPRDIQFINDIGDYIESWWPKIKEHEESINGIAPERVTGEGYSTPVGDIKGGYYPLIRDTKFSWNQLSDQLRLGNTKELLGGNYANAMTLHSHTMERSNFGDNKPLLQLDVIARHLTNVAHDLAWRKTIIDLNKLANDREIVTAIRGAAGDEMYKQINPWIRSMANSGFREPPNPVEQILSNIRRAQTIGTIGWKLSSALVHTSTLPINFKELPAEYATRGLTKFYENPLNIQKNIEFITSRDQTMKDRFEMNNYDRDVYYAMEKQLNAIGTKSRWEQMAHQIGLDKLQETAFTAMKYADGAVSGPLWMGAYEQAMDGNAGPNIKAGDEKAAIDYAGSKVRMIKGSGSAKDLAAIQRGTDFWRNTTMFYSAASASLQQMIDSGMRFQSTKNIPQLIAGIITTAVLPSYMMSFMKGKMPNPTKDPGKFGEWMAETPIEFAAHGLIGARDLAHFMENYTKYGPQYATVHLLPGEQAIEQVGKSILSTPKLVQGKKITRNETKALLDSIELLEPFPSQQVWQTGSYLYDWKTGKQKPANALEGTYRALVSGPAPKH